MSANESQNRPSRPRVWAAFIKLEHTLFSLPVMFAGALLAAGGVPETPVLSWILLAGVGARTLAMALNRLIDRRLDTDNPRTALRELPSGTMSVAEGVGIGLAGLLLYVLAVSRLPPICRWLSPVPVVVFVLYPYMKRFTPLAHFGVGLALALAPLGGWVAVRGELAGIGPAVWLALFTWLWVTGFDIIYATLDEEFDRRHGIFSLPARLGTAKALRVSSACHAVGVLTLMVLYAGQLAGTLAGLALVAVAAALVAEQRLAHRVDLAFFRINIVVGFLVLTMVAAGIHGI